MGSRLRAAGGEEQAERQQQGDHGNVELVFHFVDPFSGVMDLYDYARE